MKFSGVFQHLVETSQKSKVQSVMEFPFQYYVLELSINCFLFYAHGTIVFYVVAIAMVIQYVSLFVFVVINSSPTADSRVFKVYTNYDNKKIIIYRILLAGVFLSNQTNTVDERKSKRIIILC